MITHSFSQKVLNWYHQHGRKNLPWQKNKTLYTVWISEIMLQQTKVQFVIPYFKKFILHFPNITSLSNADLDKVLYLWSGLGYYNRAKNIYKSAKIIQKKYNGVFPDEFSAIIKLPGIGRSTAGAILSLALNFFYPILDGNVKRILIRYYGICNMLKTVKEEKKLWNIIESITPIYNTNKFNQSMMDIGSLICTHGNPKCHLCPLNQKCIAYIEETWKKCSLKKIKKTKNKKNIWFILIKYNHYIWIEKNTKKKIWNNLFYFPKFQTKIQAFKWLKEKKININVKKRKKMVSFFHKFSHFTLHIHPILIEITSNLKLFNTNEIGIWYNLSNPQYIGLPKPVKMIIDNLKEI